MFGGGLLIDDLDALYLTAVATFDIQCSVIPAATLLVECYAHENNSGFDVVSTSQLICLMRDTDRHSLTKTWQWELPGPNCPSTPVIGPGLGLNFDQWSIRFRVRLTSATGSYVLSRLHTTSCAIVQGNADAGMY
jgi:hypothetical protein